MGKIGWGTAELYSRRASSLASHATKAITVRQKDLIAPKRIEVEGVEWRAVRTDAGCERRVADDLELLGFHAYCPLGRKHVSWIGSRQLEKKLIRQFPVFSRYIFAGHEVGARRKLDADAHDKIHSILGDSRGHLAVHRDAIAHINKLELGGQWDQTKSYLEKSPLRRGAEVKITDARGPFYLLTATVDRLESEKAVWLLVSIFGRPTPLKVDPCHVELV